MGVGIASYLYGRMTDLAYKQAAKTNKENIGFLLTQG